MSLSAKKLAALADKLYTTREARYALQKQVDALKKTETEISNTLIENVSVADATGVAGLVARVTVVQATTPQVQDWDALHTHILKNAKKDPGVWALLQNRVGESAVKELWSAGKAVPGVVPFGYKKLSVNKV